MPDRNPTLVLLLIWLQAFLFLTLVSPFIGSRVSFDKTQVSLSGDPWFPFSLGPGVSFPRHFFSWFQVFLFQCSGMSISRSSIISFHSFSVFSFCRAPVFPFPGLLGFLFTE
jgi:hypothetical protein